MDKEAVPRNGELTVDFTFSNQFVVCNSDMFCNLLSSTQAQGLMLCRKQPFSIGFFLLSCITANELLAHTLLFAMSIQQVHVHTKRRNSDY